VKDTDIDQMLKSAERPPPPIPPALLQKIEDSIGASLQPVRPLPPVWLLTLGLLLIGAGIALSGAGLLGFHGFRALAGGARALIFGSLLLLAGLAAEQTVRQWIPASPGRVVPGALLLVVIAVLLGVFVLLFQDFHTENFIAAGLACLLTGLGCALPVALLSWALMRRGYAVNPIAAGLAAGVVAALAGVTLLELHCTNFEALHLLVWHTLVVPVGGGIGALAGWIAAARAPRPT
jgi:hypothetical protein